MSSSTDDELHRIADERWLQLQASGMAVSWDDPQADGRARGRGEHPRTPPARNLGR